MKHLRLLAWIDVVARVGSIRGAAERLSITSTALNRQILSFEEELGMPIFERLPRGVRLNTAGELVVHHIRTQRSEFDRLRATLADLSGLRRGHVAIASTRAALPWFLPEQIRRYREHHPAVTFDVRQSSRADAEDALMEHSVDLALVFEPVQLSEFQVISVVRQPVTAVLSADHPLAERKRLRLRECLEYPTALPSRTAGVRQILEGAASRAGIKLRPAIESESAQFLIGCTSEEDVIAFDIPLGLSARALALIGAVARPIDPRDAPAGSLYFGQLRGRTLPVASAKFAMQVAKTLDEGADAPFGFL